MLFKVLEVHYKEQLLRIDYFIRRAVNDAVVYLHGLGCSKKDFLEALHRPELHDYTLLAFDFPGCGDSPYPDGLSLEIDDLVEITHLALTALQIDDFVIIGHSMGGLVALLYAERYGEHVKGFVNVEGNLAAEDCFLSREVAQRSYSHCTTSIFASIKQKLAHSPNRGFRIYAETLEKASDSAFFDCCPSLVEYSDNGNLIRRYATLNIPKLFVYGSENRGLSYLPGLKEAGCETVEIPASNHFPGYDNPHAFYQAIAAFVQTSVLR